MWKLGGEVCGSLKIIWYKLNYDPEALRWQRSRGTLSMSCPRSTASYQVILNTQAISRRSERTKLQVCKESNPLLEETNMALYVD